MANENITGNCKLPNTQNVAKIPNVKPKSPTLFATTALIADLFACIRVYQKLINKYEHTPTKSQKPAKIYIGIYTRTKPCMRFVPLH